MENARQLQCKALRRRQKSRRQRNNGKQWKKQCAEQSEQSEIARRAGSADPDRSRRRGLLLIGEANANARQPLPASGRSYPRLVFQPSPILRGRASEKKKRSRY